MLIQCRPLPTIIIAGGGAAGFMTAAVLGKQLQGKWCVRCIHSSKMGFIGVGESNQYATRNIMQYLGLEDKDWMPKCNATYKLGIAFEGWSEVAKQYYYPFGDIPDNGYDYNTFFTLANLFPDKVKYEDFARYAAKNTRFLENNCISSEDWDFKGKTSYHFDNALMAKMMYDIAVGYGVEFIDDEIVDAPLVPKEGGEYGIDFLVTKKSFRYFADLYIDCTGFKSLLLGKALGTPYTSYSDTLINNRAIFCRLPYKNKKKQLKNYTNIVSLKNGWCGEIPLWNEMGLGYVHSTKFATEEDIEEEFREFVKDKYGVKVDEFKSLPFKCGGYEKAWVKNVVAVGLSFGFIDPLEATGLALTARNILALLEVFSRSENPNNFDRAMYNHSVVSETKNQKSFVELHYCTSHRDDTPYWNYVTNAIEYPWEEKDYQMSMNMSVVDRNYSSQYFGGLPFILAGSGYGPYSRGYEAAVTDKTEEVYGDYLRDWREKDMRMNNEMKGFYNSAEYLKHYIYNRR